MADFSDIQNRKLAIETTLAELEKNTLEQAEAESAWIAMDEFRKSDIQIFFLESEGNVEERKAKANKRWSDRMVADGEGNWVTMREIWRLALEKRTKARYKRETLLAALSAQQSLLRTDNAFIPNKNTS